MQIISSILMLYSASKMWRKNCTFHFFATLFLEFKRFMKGNFSWLAWLLYAKLQCLPKFWIPILSSVISTNFLAHSTTQINDDTSLAPSFAGPGIS